MFTPTRTVIFGPYKSGSTGLFYRIRNSLAVRPRELFEPIHYGPVPGDMQTGVLAKVIIGLDGTTPRDHYTSFLEFERRILLVRDPRDWLVSGLLFLPQQHPEIYRDPRRRESLLALLREKEQNPDRISLHQIAHCICQALGHQDTSSLLGWIPAQLAWLVGFDQSLSGHFTLRYEDFVADRLSALENYLGFALNGSSLVDAAHSHVPRSLAAGGWRNWFTAEDTRVYAPLLSSFLSFYGYPTSFHHPGPRRIDPSLCSQYVERTMAFRLRA